MGGHGEGEGGDGGSEVEQRAAGHHGAPPARGGPVLGVVARRDRAAAADLSYASAHSVVSALEESGLVRRHPRTRAYTLGPGLIGLGAAARRGYRAVDDALPEMEAPLARPRARAASPPRASVTTW